MLPAQPTYCSDWYKGLGMLESTYIGQKMTPHVNSPSCGSGEVRMRRTIADPTGSHGPRMSRVSLMLD